MNKILLAIVMLGIGFTSCNDTQVVLPQKAINAKVDSIVSARKMDIDQQAMEDLDHRSAIEVKVKADSIVQAQQAKGSKDNAINNNINK